MRPVQRRKPFDAARSHEFKVSVSHGNVDIYEQAIPWEAIGKRIEIGGKAGLALTAHVLSLPPIPTALYAFASHRRRQKLWVMLSSI